MPKESVDDYLTRKQAKGTLGQPKPYKFEGAEVLTGYCPCTNCGHEGRAMILCDPDYKDCHCCNEVCS